MSLKPLDVGAEVTCVNFEPCFGANKQPKVGATYTIRAVVDTPSGWHYALEGIFFTNTGAEKRGPFFHSYGFEAV